MSPSIPTCWKSPFFNLPIKTTSSHPNDNLSPSLTDSRTTPWPPPAGRPKRGKERCAEGQAATLVSTVSRIGVDAIAARYLTAEAVAAGMLKRLGKNKSGAGL
jgi:hypothetical protein